MDAPLLIAELGFSTLAVIVLALLALVLSAYVKIVTVLGIVRVGLGVGSLPSTLVTGGLAIVLAYFVMSPTLIDAGKVVEASLRSGSSAPENVRRAKAISAGLDRWKVFLRAHAHSEEVERFSDIARQSTHSQGAEVGDSWRILAPAFVVSELKEAFSTGLSLFLPFLVVDLLVAGILVAVGMERLDPVLVSFPFKLLLFVMVDGWSLITSNLVATYA